MSESITAHKSTIRRWIDLAAEKTGQDIATTTAENLAATIRQASEAGFVGSLLGAIDSEFGLDVEVADMEVPIDLVAAVGGIGGALYWHRQSFGVDLRNGGSSAFTVFSYRSTKKLVDTIRGRLAAKVDPEVAGEGADVGKEDPVVQAAREL